MSHFCDGIPSNKWLRDLKFVSLLRLDTLIEITKKLLFVLSRGLLSYFLNYQISKMYESIFHLGDSCDLGSTLTLLKQKHNAYMRSHLRILYSPRFTCSLRHDLDNIHIGIYTLLLRSFTPPTPLFCQSNPYDSYFGYAYVLVSIKISYFVSLLRWVSRYLFRSILMTQAYRLTYKAI